METIDLSDAVNDKWLQKIKRSDGKTYGQAEQELHAKLAKDHGKKSKLLELIDKLRKLIDAGEA